MTTQISKRKPASPRQAARRRAPIDSLLDPALFKALGDPSRVRLLGCLIKCARPCSVGELAECCAVDLSVVSRHLRVLERAGALSSIKQGRTVTYTVRHEPLAAKLRALADSIDACAALADGDCCEGDRRARR